MFGLVPSPRRTPQSPEPIHLHDVSAIVHLTEPQNRQPGYIADQLSVSRNDISSLGSSLSFALLLSPENSPSPGSRCIEAVPLYSSVPLVVTQSVVDAVPVAEPQPHYYADPSCAEVAAHLPAREKKVEAKEPPPIRSVVDMKTLKHALTIPAPPLADSHPVELLAPLLEVQPPQEMALTQQPRSTVVVACEPSKPAVAQQSAPEPLPPSVVEQATVHSSYLPEAQAEKEGKKGERKDQVQKKQQRTLRDVDWEELRRRIPVARNKIEQKKRKELFVSFDRHKRKSLLYDDVLFGCQHILKLPEFFGWNDDAVKLASKGAFVEARLADKKAPSTPQSPGTDGVEMCEFRLMLVYLRQYVEIYLAFEILDTSGDRTLGIEEFIEAIPLMNEWGIKCSKDNAQATFNEIDQDKQGAITADEFAQWALKAGLDLGGDDDFDDDTLHGVREKRAVPDSPNTVKPASKRAPTVPSKPEQPTSPQPTPKTAPSNVKLPAAPADSVKRPPPPATLPSKPDQPTSLQMTPKKAPSDVKLPVASPTQKSDPQSPLKKMQAPPTGLKPPQSPAAGPAKSTPLPRTKPTAPPMP